MPDKTEHPPKKWLFRLRRTKINDSSDTAHYQDLSMAQNARLQ
jgi:hypothetical protein